MALAQLCFVTLIFMSRAQAQDAPMDKEMVKSLVEFGVALGNIPVQAAKDGLIQANVPTDQYAATMKKITDGYVLTRDVQRGAASATGASLDVALTGSDIATGGSMILATSSLRLVKNIAIGALTKQMDEAARNGLAKAIDDQMSNSDYAALQNRAPQEVIQELDKIQVFQDIAKSVGDDQGAKEIFQNTVVNLIKNTQKTTLHQLGQAQQDIEANRKQIVDISQQVSSYMSAVNSNLQDLTDTASAIRSQVADIQTQTSANTQQLALIEDFSFSKASATEKLTLLKGGYLQSRLPPEDFKILFKATEAQAKTEAFVVGMNQVVTEFNQIGIIAKNLHVGGAIGHDLQEAVSYASTVNAAISSIASGNYLGAIAGITGLFGGPSEEELFHQQLFSYLDSNFNRVNKKLDDLIEQQKFLMEGIQKLSEQMAQYNTAVQRRFDLLDVKVDHLQASVSEVLYWPLLSCDNIRGDVNDFLSLHYSPVNLSDIQQASQVTTQADYDKVFNCIDYLRTLYDVTFTKGPKGFTFEPLAMRYTTAVPAGSYVEPPQAINDYNSSVKPEINPFYEGQYIKTYDVFNTARQLALPFATDRPELKNLRLSSTVAMAAIPSDTVNQYRAKLVAFGTDAPVCARGTSLSDPLVAVLCHDDGDGPDRWPGRLQLSGIQVQREKMAEDRADEYMKAPLLQDAIVTLSEYARFFAPIYEYLDIQHKGVFQDTKSFVTKSGLVPRGPRLLNGALRTLTLGVAEMDMLYGDMTSGFLFNALWHDAAGESGFAQDAAGLCVSNDGTKKADAESVCELKKDAMQRLEGNPYLQRNMLMLALDHVAGQVSDGQLIRYTFAKDYMSEANSDPDAFLNDLFKGKLKFTNVWTPLDYGDSPQSAIQHCSAAPEETKCYKVPSVTVGTYTSIDPDGRSITQTLNVPLPEPGQFRARAFVYPQSMLTMISERDRAAAQMADYQVFKWATAKDANPTDSSAQLVRTLAAINK
jgi:hypothetical protein